MNIIKSIKRAVGRIASSLVPLALLTLTANAQIPVPPVSYSLLSGVTTLTNAQTLTVNSYTTNGMFRGRGIGFWISSVATDNCAAFTTASFQFSPDATNWSIFPTNFSVAVPQTNTTVSLLYSNLPVTVVDNIRYIRLNTLKNGHTNSITVSNALFTVFP